MIVFLLLFITLCLWRVRYSKAGFHEDFLSVDKTNAIKGIFIVTVFISHIKGYYITAGADLSHWYDYAFFQSIDALGQLIVVMFLFYSGYGVSESIKKYGHGYVLNIPRKRILKTLVNFDVAVIIFTIAWLFIGNKIDIQKFVLSLLAWDSVGNSNWYIFCIIACYMFTYISYRINSRGGYLSAFLIAYIVLMSFYKESWWHNTILSYGAGIMFSKHKDFFLEHFRKSYYKCIIYAGLGFLFMPFCYIFVRPYLNSGIELAASIRFNIMSVFFAFFIVLVTMKWSLCNHTLTWLGAHLFPIYIYQRLPMMVLATLYPQALVVSHPYVYMILCVIITGVIASVYAGLQMAFRSRKKFH